jgi:hypothetical protein
MLELVNKMLVYKLVMAGNYLNFLYDISKTFQGSAWGLLMKTVYLPENYEKMLRNGTKFQDQLEHTVVLYWNEKEEDQHG